jgi:hypothetical protein
MHHRQNSLDFTLTAGYPEPFLSSLRFHKSLILPFEAETRLNNI